MGKYDAANFIEQYISERGITLRHIANNTSIKYELLRRSIHDHTRKLGADEFLEILEALKIKLVFNEKERGKMSMRIIGDTDGIISEEECKKINSQIIEILRPYNLTVFQALYVLQSAGWQIENASTAIHSKLLLNDCPINL